MQRILLAFALVVAGCGDDSTQMDLGNTGGNDGGVQINPSVSLVSPSTVFLGRTLDVHLAGYGTMWNDSTTINFGDGVAVNKVTAASETGLTVNITVADTAAEGPRDVTVMDGGKNELFKSTFTIAAPIKVTVLGGGTSQGSIPAIHIDLIDIDHVFDTTQTGDGFVTPKDWPNISITANGMLQLQLVNVTPTSIDAFVGIDVSAPAGMQDLKVQSGPSAAAATNYVAPRAVSVTARTPTALPAGSTDGTVTSAYASALYQISPGAGGHFGQLAVSSTDITASPQFYLIPKSGKFADQFILGATGAFAAANEDPFYVVVLDNTGTANYPFTLDLALTVVTPLASETEPANDSDATATALTVPTIVANADFKAASDEDWYAITATAGDVNKVIHVVTSPGDARSDQVIDILDSSLATMLTNASSGDRGYFEDVTSNGTITAAGTYYVHVTWSIMYTAFHTPNHYNMYVALE